MNPLVLGLAPSLIRAINERRKPGDIDLGIGQPTFPPDYEAFEAGLEWTRLHGSPYSPNAGIGELREAILAYQALDGGWDALAPDDRDVCVTVGSEEALYLAIKTVLDSRSDEVLIVEPSYLAYAKLCAMEGIPYRTVALSAETGFRPEAQRVIEAVGPRTRMVVLNSPNNPTARVWSGDEFAVLARFLRERPERTYVLADEVYRELYYEGSSASMASHYEDTLIASSLSKSCALTGLRLGWLAGPRDVIAEAVKVHQLVTTSTSTFSQRVGLELLRDPARVAAHRPLYAARRERLLLLADRLQLRIVPPEGAFYALLQLPPPLAADSIGAAVRVLDEARVITVPGKGFGESAEGYLRVSWAAPDEQLEVGLTRIAGWLAGEMQNPHGESSAVPA